MLISYNRLVELVENGVINAKPEHINSASIDITLDDILIDEWGCEIELKEGFEHIVRPGEFYLASSREIFNLPNNVAAEYKLKSSMARIGLNHLLAGWCDPGWQNSKLTLELKNVTQSQDIKLKTGMKIGQMVFWQTEPVPDNKSYAKVGRYNNQTKVTPGLGIK